MPPAKTSSDKIDLTLDSMKVTLQIIVELAELSPAKCVAPIIGSFLKIIQIFEVRRAQGVLLSSLLTDVLLLECQV